MEFKVLKDAVAKRFAEMCKSKQLFRTGISGDDLWFSYLSAFPDGTNPIYRVRTEHDCSCCKSFIRAVGNVVAIVDGELVSIWDVEIKEPAYQAVANALSKRVKMFGITDTFLHWDKVAGVDKTFEQLVEGQKSWGHFFVNIPAKFVKPNKDIPTALNLTRTTEQVFARALLEITDDAVQTVLELIDQNALYRGQEHKFAVSKFREMQATRFEHVHTFAWLMIDELPASVTNIRNTSIGTLLVDLSEGMDLESAVKKFEAMVAPANYKRPTALVTQAMIDRAKVEVAELGLTSALERRYAVLSDINVNNVLFVNRSARKSVVGGDDAFSDLKPTKSVKPKLDKVEDVPIETFMKDILPRAETIEVMVENRHTSNFVSLIAPVDPTAGKLFKWDNGFSWSYNGEVADSDLRREVQARGGRVDGVFRFSHSWNHPGQRNVSLMDLHVFMPGSTISAEHRINDVYGTDERVGWNRRQHSASGGVQDVDFTNEAPANFIPVENITFPTLSRLKDGQYICKIHNWDLRQPTTGGFKAEIEFDGQVFQYEHTSPLKHKEWITVAVVTLKNGIFSIEHKLPTTATASTPREVWGISTQQFQPVSTLMLSPNYWDGHGVGNKHWFFMLEGVKNDGSVRGFYNEFLHSDLDKHRKVLELVGSKIKVADSPEQLSGLGFSSTQRNKLTCRITGSFSRIINLVF